MTMNAGNGEFPSMNLLVSWFKSANV